MSDAVFPNAPRCTATSKGTGERCRNPAVTGFNVCRHHGAGSPRKGRPGGRPIVHGRYSSKLPERLAAMYETAKDDGKLLELRDEIALVTARLSELLERLDTETGGQHWAQLQDTWQKLKKATATKDYLRQQQHQYELGQLIERGATEAATWAEIYSLIDQRRKLSESEWKRLVQLQHVITAERALALMAAIVHTVREHVKDEQALRAIAHEIRLLATRDIS